MKKNKKIILWIVSILSVLVLLPGGMYMMRNRAVVTSREQTAAAPHSLQDKRVLLVYYSWSGTTRDVIYEIRKKTGGDVYELVPEKPYTGSHSEVSEQAKEEQEQAYRPKIKNPLPDLALYDVIILDYPIWWYEEPMIVDSFLAAATWEGKIILPFCTSGGSTVDQSVDNIRRQAHGATVLPGLTLPNGSGTDGLSEWLSESGF